MHTNLERERHESVVTQIQRVEVHVADPQGDGGQQVATGRRGGEVVASSQNPQTAVNPELTDYMVSGSLRNPYSAAGRKEPPTSRLISPPGQLPWWAHLRLRSWRFSRYRRSSGTVRSELL